MKRMLLLTMLLLTGTLIFSQTANEKYMPVTTTSKSALSYYTQAMKYYDDVKVKDALENFKKALNLDHDFFMVNYQLAVFFLMNRSSDNFDVYADAAINCKARISQAEELLKEALIRLQKSRTDLTDLGKKLVTMYPNDPNSYNNLIYFQSLNGDSIGIVETLTKAIKIAAKPGTYYNQLGYAYMTLKETDKAEEAFDKYIALEPKNPNAYDSKGDFYMYVKKYDKAYESYMQAHSMDSSFSEDKAAAAKQLYEQTEGKKLEIISM
jgi:tetratricopeptide (TPR) repeat protein